MGNETAIVNFYIRRKNGQTDCVDIEIPLYVSANEFVVALNTAYKLEIDTEKISNCYLKSENPIALLRGSKLLSEYGIMNGTKIFYDERV